MTTATLERPITTEAEQPTREAEDTLGARYEPTCTQAPEGLDSKVRKAAARYLEVRGFDILDQEWLCDNGLVDIICWDGDTLVFVDVQTAFDGFPDQDDVIAKRSLMEAVAIDYLGENEYVDIPVRFDAVCIVPVGTDRAFLRHHSNVLGMM